MLYHKTAYLTSNLSQNYIFKVKYHKTTCLIKKLTTKLELSDPFNHKSSLKKQKFDVYGPNITSMQESKTIVIG